MIQKKRRVMSEANGSKGFTLVEMALVLIIIGIIIGAIVKGNDLVRGAEQKRIYSKFIGGWRLAYMNFYDRTGKILGDTTNGANPGQDGQADTAGGGSGLVTSPSPAAYLGLTQVGLSAPTSNTGNAWEYNYVNSQGSTNTLTVAFDWATPGNYNFLQISNLPTELALALDTMIDGSADGTAGDFIRDVNATWADANATAINTARWRMQF